MASLIYATVARGDHVRIGNGTVDWEVESIHSKGLLQQKVANLKSGMTGKHKFDVPVVDLAIVKRGAVV